jgi:hypothetical protein
MMKNVLTDQVEDFRKNVRKLHGIKKGCNVHKYNKKSALVVEYRFSKYVVNPCFSSIWNIFLQAAASQAVSKVLQVPP